MSLNIIFMGTPAFALPTLNAILDEPRFNLRLVVTKPDRPQGRGLRTTPSPVKVAAQARLIPVFQPESLKDAAVFEHLRQLEPDFIVVVAYGFFLPKKIIDLPRFATVNLHPSLLPRYRGPAPLNWPLINGDKETGVTSMLICEKMDAGDILLQQKIPIRLDDTLETMHDLLADLGASCMKETLIDWASGKIKRRAQDESAVSFAPKLTDQNTRIDWSADSLAIFNKIRGLSPKPGAHTVLNGRQVILYEAALSRFIAGGKPGTFNCFSERGIVINCGKSTIEITELKLANKKKMAASEFIKGYRQEIFFQ